MTLEEKINLIRLCEKKGFQLEQDNDGQYVLYTDVWDRTCSYAGCGNPIDTDDSEGEIFCSDQCKTYKELEIDLSRES